MGTISTNFPVIGACPRAAGVPIDLAESERGNFFIGYAANLGFGSETSAWAGLLNPPDSGVNLFVYAFSITGIVNTDYRIQIWFNAGFPGEPHNSDNIAPANTAITPLHPPKIKLQFASQVGGTPSRGVKAFVRRGSPNESIYSIEDGKFIFPPGGNFTIFLSNPENPTTQSTGKIFYQWWEEQMDTGNPI